MAVYTRLLPAVLTALAVAGFYALPVRPLLLADKGLLSGTLSVLSTLPGFYFAGLAAVATFGAASMDRVMPAPPPTLMVKDKGVSITLELSRRQFLAYLFSYLTILSLGCCVAIVILVAAAPAVAAMHVAIEKLKHGWAVWQFIRLLFVSSMFGALSSILVTTLHGMFFLTEKIHQP